MVKYKLLVLDIDGTLLNGKKQISARTKIALLKAQQLGVQIVLASGRPTYGVLPVARELEMDRHGGFILSYNGCQIFNVQTGELLFEKRIDPRMFPLLERLAKKRAFPIFTYHQDKIITDSPRNKRVLSEAKLNGMEVVRVDHFAEAIDFSPCKCMFVSEDAQSLDELRQYLKKHLAGTMDIFPSEEYFLEIVPRSIDKANTLSVLADILNVEMSEIIAIGDGVCDVTMIQMAGLGVAMENAQISVRRCADYVTASNDNDGVAAVVESRILANIRPAEIPLAELNARAKDALMGHLGIQYTYASESRIEATMPVDHRTRQPFGILHGGATLALAETVAGLGSMILCQPDEVMVGMQVSGNHVSSAHEGDTVRAVATIIHKGRSSHVWDVNIFTSTDKLISSVRVLNSILKKHTVT
ncbi:MAG: Cof-type HAD-IIB family hydrolase [Tannerella sp.]|jgi:Cof subfamily protein (haloacid dehalogenase superfamily)|nr:Cof-type HAD-IIB family hydrolase [Tannerella sp.]